MGVEGLWSILQPAAATESLAQIATRAFNSNTYRHRGFTVGIDVSIWLGHTKVFRGKPQSGQNPGLQMLFFRCARLAALTILPLFVFNGDQRPGFKRGKTQHYKKQTIETDAQEIIDAFGFAWREAPGEAEAELASLNGMGVIDAVWTDNGDAFLFGAVTVFRKSSSALSSSSVGESLNTAGMQVDSHVRVYKAADVVDNDEIGLTRNGLILVALLRGGDYHQGVNGVGVTIAHALARCGFGDTLASTVQSLKGKPLAMAIAEWRSSILEELRTDSQGQLGKRHPKLAADFPADFPDLDVYNAYANPVVSSAGGLAIRWYCEPNIADLAEACERHFSWCSQIEILDRFRSLIWLGVVCRALRQHTLEGDGMGEYLDPAQQQLGALVTQIHAERSHPSTDGLRELRVEVAPTQLANAVRRATSSLRLPPVKYTPRKAAPDAALRIWLPAELVRAAMPELVDAFETRAEQRGKGKKRHAEHTSGSSSDSNAPPRKASRNVGKALPGPGAQEVRVPLEPAPASATANSKASASTAVIVISSSEDDANPGTPQGARASGSAVRAALGRNGSAAEVIIISSSDEE